MLTQLSFIEALQNIYNLEKDTATIRNLVVNGAHFYDTEDKSSKLIIKKNWYALMQMVKHPLVAIQFELYTNNKISVYNMMCNITSQFKYGCIHYKNPDVFFVNNPCIIYNNMNFHRDFVRSNHNEPFLHFEHHKESYQKDLILRLNSNAPSCKMFVNQTDALINLKHKLRFINVHK